MRNQPTHQFLALAVWEEGSTEGGRGTRCLLTSREPPRLGRQSTLTGASCSAVVKATCFTNVFFQREKVMSKAILATTVMCSLQSPVFGLTGLMVQHSCLLSLSLNQPCYMHTAPSVTALLGWQCPSNYKRRVQKDNIPFLSCEAAVTTGISVFVLDTSIK